jgi:hypothetical protein
MDRKQALYSLSAARLYPACRMMDGLSIGIAENTVTLASVIYYRSFPQYLSPWRG